MTIAIAIYTISSLVSGMCIAQTTNFVSSVFCPNTVLAIEERIIISWKSLKIVCMVGG